MKNVDEQASFSAPLTARHGAKTMRRFLRSMGEQRLRLVVVLFSVAAYSVLTVLAPFYSAEVVDLLWNHTKALRAAGETFSLTWEIGGRQIFLLLLLFLFAAAESVEKDQVHLLAK